MADERRLQLVEVVEEDEETVLVLGLYSRAESLLILSYLNTTIQIPKVFFGVNLFRTSCCSSSRWDSPRSLHPRKLLPQTPSFILCVQNSSFQEQYCTLLSTLLFLKNLPFCFLPSFGVLVQWTTARVRLTFDAWVATRKNYAFELENWRQLLIMRPMTSQ